jgi:hypothetical protein
LGFAARALETTLAVPRGARTVHMFRLDEDLSEFYELVRDDELAWCALGAGRMDIPGPKRSDHRAESLQYCVRRAELVELGTRKTVGET